jgi:hypothetical protein
VRQKTNQMHPIPAAELPNQNPLGNVLHDYLPNHTQRKDPLVNAGSILVHAIFRRLM